MSVKYRKNTNSAILLQ